MEQMLANQKLAHASDRSMRLAEIRAVAETVNGRMIAFTAALSDLDPSVRLFAHQALEITTRVSKRLDQFGPSDNSPVLYEARTVSAEEANSAPEALSPGALKKNDELLATLSVTLPSLAGAMRDPEHHVRRASVDVLESLGTAARPESGALIAALRDSDLYVRWAAARVLGRLGPIDDDAAVKGLTELLGDSDIDVRIAAAEALRRYGSAACDAVPALIHAINHSEPGTRVAAIRTLEDIGVSPSLVIPALMTAMGAPETRVRQAAAQFLGRIGPEARDATICLRAALDDPDTGVRKAANDALLEVFPPQNTESPTLANSDPIRQVGYVESPEPSVRMLRAITDRVIASTPPVPKKSSFAADTDGEGMPTPGWRPLMPAVPAAALSPPTGARPYSKVRAND
jgi:hypothetical protein